MLGTSKRTIRKVLIVGLDGLEYDLVKKFDLKNLKQVEFGKVDVSQFRLLSTPMIWASFITGLPPEKHDVKIGRGWNNSFIHLLYEKLELFSHKVGLQRIERLRGKFLGQRFLEQLGFRSVLLYYGKEHFQRRGIKTIFDLVNNSIPLHVPTYYTRQEFQERIRVGEGEALRDAIDNPKMEKIFEEKHIWNNFKIRRKDCLAALESDWRLLFAYFRYTDPLGHLFRRHITKMWEGYAMADELVADLKSRINEENTLFLIISDHGMKPLGRYGFHSNHGFYSTNQRLGLEKPKIVDFFHIILEWLGYEY